MSDLVTLPERSTAVKVFSTENGLDPFLEKIRAEIDGFTPDVSTAKGRKEIASIAYKVAQSKTALDNMGKELVAELKDVPKKIDAERKRMRDLLDSWKDEVRQPLTEYEEAEAKYKRDRDEWIDGLRRDYNAMQNLSSKEISTSIANVEETVIDPAWLGEHEAEAHRVKDDTLQNLKRIHAGAVEREKQQAELERLRKEAAEREQAERESRIAREAEERARREAEEAARQQQQEAMQREAEAKANAERAERDRAEAVERQRQAEQRAEAERLAAEERAKQAAEQARQQEIQRQQAEQQRIENEQRQREQDRAHRASINNQILDDLRQQGLTEECAKTAIRAIASGNVRNVKINY